MAWESCVQQSVQNGRWWVGEHYTVWLYYFTVCDSETPWRMGTSFWRGDFWDHLGAQALVMIGGWYSRQPLTNHEQPLPTQMIPEIFAQRVWTHSPHSFWSGE